MIYERMNINMRFDLFGILHTHTLVQRHTHKTKYCTFAEVFFSGGTGCRKNGLGDKTMLGQSRNNNGSVCGAAALSERREKGCGPRGKRAKVLRSDIAPLVFMCA
jgi:hypothetical protein